MPEQMVLKQCFTLKANPLPLNKVNQYLLNHGWARAGMACETCQVYWQRNAADEIIRVWVPSDTELVDFNYALNRVLNTLSDFEDVTVWSVYQRILNGDSSTLESLTYGQQLILALIAGLHAGAQGRAAYLLQSKKVMQCRKK